MPADETINVAAQVIASRRWRLKFRDVKAAFSQSVKSNHRRHISMQTAQGRSVSRVETRKLDVVNRRGV